MSDERSDRGGASRTEAWYRALAGEAESDDAAQDRAPALRALLKEQQRRAEAEVDESSLARLRARILQAAPSHAAPIRRSPFPSWPALATAAGILGIAFLALVGLPDPEVDRLLFRNEAFDGARAYRPRSAAVLHRITLADGESVARGVARALDPMVPVELVRLDDGDLVLTLIVEGEDSLQRVDELLSPTGVRIRSVGRHRIEIHPSDD